LARIKGGDDRRIKSSCCCESLKYVYTDRRKKFGSDLSEGNSMNEVMTMKLNNFKITLLAGLVAALLSSVAAFAQQIPVQANPTPGCTSTPAQLAAAKKTALDFAFLTGEAKVAMADPAYIQHNPMQHKRAKDQNISDFESFKMTFLAPPAAPAAGGGGVGRGAAAGPQPPAGNRAEIILAECDIVTVIHKVYLQDPTAVAGTFYEAFTFDAYRVKNGKVVEHWDAGTLAPPVPAGAGR
jgi:predicted SnoaL-like aldol condensation-catalyzing enzyme